MEKIDWEAIYAKFDGNMDACLGKDCLESCCKQKMTYVYKKPKQSYLTSFADQSEIDYQNNQLDLSCEDLGVEAGVFDIGLERSGYAVLVDKCLDPENGCKLEGRKPLMCRIYPFRESSRYPIYSGCPQILELIEDEKIVSIVMEIRTMLGCEDNESWFAKLQYIKSELMKKSF